MLQPRPPSTIIIDEPELGLRPMAISLLADMVKTAARHTQVIVATQCPQLIDHFGVEDLIVSTFVDYYGVKEWPGLEDVRDLYEPTPDVIAKIMNDDAVSDIRAELPNVQVDRRYIPFTAVHEFEALLFSDAEILSRELGIDITLIRNALAECGSPERINNHPETSPSNRLIAWTAGGMRRGRRRGWWSYQRGAGCVSLWNRG